MAVTLAQVTQYENQASDILNTALSRSGIIDVYVSTIEKQKVETKFKLEENILKSLNAATSFLNRSEIRNAQSDLVYGTRVTAAVAQAREAKAIAQAALDTIRSVIPKSEPIEPDATNRADSVGQIVSEDKAGREPGATTQTPETNSLTPNPGTNANQTETSVDAGVGVASDDVGGTAEDLSLSTNTPGGTSGQNDVKYPSEFEQNIKTTVNSLSGMSTYTYQLSIYLMTPEQFTAMSRSEIKSVAGLSLLMQSGGQIANGQSDLNGATRNKHFDLDYFIEDLEMESLMPRSVRGATNQTRLNFKIIEPYGFTFIERLKAAVKDFFGTTDFVKQHYLMTIKFKGYDEEGNEVTSKSSTDSVTIDNNRSDASSINEKFIPFKFANIVTKASTGAVEYVCEALPVNHFEALSQKRATIPFQLEIKGQTLDDLFNGKSDLRDTRTSKRVISSGLVDALNKQQQEYVAKGAIAVADKYKITFAGGNIAQQKVMPPGDIAKSRTASVDPNLPSHLLTNVGQVEKETFTVSVSAGQQLQQSVDGILKTSQYITGQQKVFYDSVKRAWLKKDGGKVLAWYKITTKVEPIAYDKIRKDYAYLIELVITPQQVTDVKSTAFPKDRFRGVHKKFNYWFTGENTEVIDYEVEFNALFYTSLSAKFANEATEQAKLEQLENLAPGAVGPSDQSGQNGAGQSADEAARAASVLYSPVDFAKMEMEVLGDPDFIQQGDIFYRAGNNFGAFLQDGSINYDSQEVFVEVNYNTIEDYNEETGEATPKDIQLKSVDQYVRTGTKGLIYQIIAVKNKFIKGQFTQTLEGLMVEFPDNTNVGVGKPTLSPPTVTTASNSGPKLDLPFPDFNNNRPEENSLGGGATLLSGRDD